MEARKCDRCGNFYDRYSYPTTQKGPYYHGNKLTIENEVYHNNHYIKSFDLCTNCMDELESFLGMNKEKENDSKGNT